MFNPRYKTFVHVAQVLLIIVVLGLAGYRMANRNPNVPQGAGDTMAISMAAKGLVIIAYQLLTEHVARFQRWASLKANLILNCLEIVLWAAVGGMTIQRLTRYCGEGAVCAVGWLITVLAFVFSISSMYCSVLAYKEYKAGKRASYSYRTSSVPLHRGGSSSSKV